MLTVTVRLLDGQVLTHNNVDIIVDSLFLGEGLVLIRPEGDVVYASHNVLAYSYDDMLVN